LPDSRRWLFATENGSRLAMMDTTARRVSDVFVPTAGTVDAFNVAVSGDGRTLFLTQTQRESDLWLMDLK
ncbi:MAG: hypothetical protein ACREKH_13090, partial [Candidatus Rokuibacteriota bacterium]